MMEISIELVYTSACVDWSILTWDSLACCITKYWELIWFDHVSGCLLQDNALRSPIVVALCTWCIALLESPDNTLMLRQEGSTSLPDSAEVHEGNPRHSISKRSKYNPACLFQQTPAMKRTCELVYALHSHREISCEFAGNFFPVK